MTDCLNIAEHLSRQADRRPDAPTLISPGGNLTLGELEDLSNRCAAGLRRAGVTPGTRTVLMVRPGPEFLVLAFGLVKAGAVLVVVDPGMGWKNLGKCLSEAQPRAFVGIPLAHLARLLFGWARATLEIQVTVGGPRLWRGPTYRQLLESPDEAWAVSSAPDDAAAVVFTSGSTGVPKGVVYTHRMFSAQVELLRSSFGIEEGEADLATFPLFGLFDPGLGMTTIFPKMDFSRPGRVDPVKIVEAVEKNRASHMFGSPALLDRVGRYGEQKGVKLPSIRRVLSAGAPVSPRILKRFAALLDDGAEIHTPYGATEALPVCSIESREVLSETGTARGWGVCVGKPLPGVSLAVIKISDGPIEKWSRDLRVENGQVGELAVWGDNVSTRYYGRPEADRLAKIAGPGGTAIHRMGDLGWLDERGRVWFCGRKAHRVQTHNGTIFSVACEGIFNQHPAVLRTALVGIGDPPRQTPVLCVELEDKGNWKGSQQLGQEILALGADHPQGSRIAALLFHPRFPVDVRHNAKIFREKLAVWAARRLKFRPGS